MYGNADRKHSPVEFLQDWGLFLDVTFFPRAPGLRSCVSAGGDLIRDGILVIFIAGTPAAPDSFIRPFSLHFVRPVPSRAFFLLGPSEWILAPPISVAFHLIRVSPTMPSASLYDYDGLLRTSYVTSRGHGRFFTVRNC